MDATQQFTLETLVSRPTYTWGSLSASLKASLNDWGTDADDTEEPVERTCDRTATVAG